MQRSSRAGGASVARGVHLSQEADMTKQPKGLFTIGSIAAIVFPTMFLSCLLLPTGRENQLSSLAVFVIPLLLGLMIHVVCYRLKLPNLFGFLSIVPIVVVYVFLFQDLARYEVSLNGCMSSYCDQEPMIVLLNRMTYAVTLMLSILIMAGIGCQLWLRRHFQLPVQST